MADLTERATGQNIKFEGKLLKKFSPIFAPTRYEMQPCIVKDKDGNIMLWYIPGAITTQRAVSPLSLSCNCFPAGPRLTDRGQTKVWEDLKVLEKSFRINKSGTSWRAAPTFFRAEEGWLKPGSVSMAPAWFQQGHEVESDPFELIFL